MFLKSKKFMLTSLFVLSSTIYADGLENSNTKHKSSTQNQPTNSKIKRKSTASDSFERKKIYQTKYFKIYYDKNSVKQAQELIRVADQIAEVESKLFKMEMPKEIKVYVMDTQDNSNAFSTGFGIHLFITNNGAITNEYKDYIPYLFSHELTHELLDYKMAGNGINKYIPMSDRIILDTAIPRWWTEGMAVLVESMISKGGGRTFDPAFIAIAKRDLNEDKFRGLGPTYHNRPYEYGNSFMRFYLETYGVEKVSEAIDYYSSHKVGGIGSAFGHIANLDADQLYKAWMGYLAKIVDDVKGDLVEGPSIFDNHSWNAQVIKDGDNIWTYSIEKREDASFEAGHKRSWLKLLKIPFDDKGNPNYEDVKDYSFATDIIGNQPAIKGNNIYYASNPKKSTFRGSEDNIAYRYNIETGEQTLLKDLIRPDKFVNINGKIYYTFLQHGVSGISTLSNQVVLEPNKFSISSLSDAGNNKILFVAKVGGEEGSKIFLLDPKTKEIEFLANGKSGYLDGKSLYFTDNFGEEANNVYKKDLDSDKVTKLTNVLYNATNPVVITTEEETKGSSKDDEKSEEKSSVEHKKLVYLNFTTSGDSISQLEMKYAVNDEKNLLTLEKERKERQTKNNELYGDYGKAYNPNIVTTVTVDELKANKEKEVKGFYFPDLTKPSITVSNSGVGVVFNSANVNTRLILSYEESSHYSGIKSVVQPKKVGINQKETNVPIYFSSAKSGYKTDKYNLGLIHNFSAFSGSQFGYFHSEYLAHGESIDGKDSQGNKNRTHIDEMYLTIPFNISAIDKSVYLSVHTRGDLQDDTMDNFEKLYSDKVELEFGYDKTSSFLIGDAKTKFGMVIKNKKSHDGNSGTNYFYVDRDIKSDIPYIDSLSFLKLRTRLYFAPKTFTDNSSSLTELSSSGLGFSSVGGNSDDVKSFITNARFASKIYGDMNYRIPIEKGSDFGMVYLNDVQLRLGYSYTAFMDEDYNEQASILSKWKSAFPKVYAAYGGRSATQIKSDITYLNNLGAKIASSLGAKDPKMIEMITKVGMGEIVFPNAKLDKLIKDVFKLDPKAKVIVDKYKGSNLQNVLYLAQNAPQKEKKFRHGITINPSATLNGNLYNDSASFGLSVGNTYIADFTNDNLSNTDFWYVSVKLRF
ncbi:MAG: hypothetical protein WBG30_13300 [Psychrilyobacter sp.]|uniref:hypothetical protein n=1 Tax=Psychrilyobacter sp. TaxID=2586924 RepID=UPI003C707A1C